VDEVLHNAELDKIVIDGLILTGDSSYVAKIQPAIQAYFYGSKLYSGLKSDEVFVKGVAVQARVLGGAWQDDYCPPLMDVVPLSRGVETVGGFFTKILRRNTVIPARKALIFSTVSENQEKVVLKIYSGERAMVKDNKLLGTLELDGLLKKSLGEVEIEVLFEMNPDFSLTVIAKEKAGGTEAQVVFDDGNVTFETMEVDEMLQDAEKFAKEDLVMVEMSRENRWKGSSRFGVVLSTEDQHRG
jgi:molecular chaperone DnaK (HSP70)